MTFWENDNVIKNEVMVSDETIGVDDRLSVVEKATILIIDDNSIKHLTSIQPPRHNYSHGHSKLKDRLKELVQLCFIKMNGQHRYKYLVLGRNKSIL